METSLKGRKNNGNRKFRGGGKRPDHTDTLRREAKERDDYWRSLSPTQQMADLDKRLGKGLGAKKQRERILAKINKSLVEHSEKSVAKQETVKTENNSQEKRKQKRDRPARAG